ncbi:Dps family protein [Methylobrevis pamukkalensis]|uniref:DNA protection during starvation protein n=1 Tax=Methylobrevis pamukkalensis TaxID=1439726 RepID=A0A1E3H6J1_9HYPH|nr:Dps family protein [Methylobrevis pamukkalensis]ODN71406.1 DNA protection during starvation protein [Methylobrevis pamukkalensis]
MKSGSANISPISRTDVVKTGLEPSDREKIAESLSAVLEDTYSLLVKTQIVHWNVRSAAFLSIHELTETQYNELFGAIDVIAERILALGFHVPSKQGHVLSPTGEAVDPEASANDMLELLAGIHEACANRARDAAEDAEEMRDFVTHDLLTERIGAHEKAIWMLRAHISV